MADATVSTSTALRIAIQQANDGDTITLLDPINSTFGSVLTLAKNVCGSNYYTTLADGYVINGDGQQLNDTRIFQQNVDGPYSPGSVTGGANGLVLNYQAAGAADFGALFSARNATYDLSNLVITGTHSGWVGNGGKYFSFTSFDPSDPVSVNLTLSNSTIDITGQTGFNRLAANAGGSAFMHSWNNVAVNPGDGVTLSGNTFDESGFLSSFNFTNFVYTAPPVLNNVTDYVITGNTFTRIADPNGVFHTNEGNRLTNVEASLVGNTFSEGSYLDLYGNVSDITFGNNTFNAIAGGYGIRANSTTGSIAQLASGVVLTFTTVNGSVPIKNVSTISSVFTLSASSTSNVNINTIDYKQASAGGQGNDSINGSGAVGRVWANGDDGNDTILGGGDIDLLYGGNGDDVIDAGVGSDLVYGEAGNDSLFGSGGADQIYGDDGNDTLRGGDQSDTLTGGLGNDILDGENDSDSLMGGDGNDTLTGGLANDIITGGDGNDLFKFGTSDGTDTVTDFSTSGALGVDQIGLLDIFSVAGNNTLATGDVTTASSITNIASGSSNKVIIMTGSLTTTNINSITSSQVAGSGRAAPAYMMCFNNTSGINKGQLWYDADWSTRAGRTHLATFDSLSSLASVTALTNTSFFAYS